MYVEFCSDISLITAEHRDSPRGCGPGRGMVRERELEGEREIASEREREQ